MSKETRKEDARLAALDDFLNQVNPKKGDLEVFTFETAPQRDVEAFSTGGVTLDVALGVGGIPRGRVVEIYGPESSGKTSLALSICANAVKEGELVGYIDVENAIDFKHVNDMGVDLKYFALSQPESAEAGLQMVETMAKNGNFGVIVVDSVAALTTQAELDGEIGDVRVADLARLMSKALRRLVGVANQTNTTIIFINQIREKIGVMFGNPETTPGGRALKYYSSVRLEIRSTPSDRLSEGAVKDGKFYGQKCRVEVKKNKVAPPFKKAEYKLIFGKGIDKASSALEAAVAVGVVIAGNGGTFTYAADGNAVGPRGKDNTEKHLNENPEIAEALIESVYERLRSNQEAWRSLSPDETEEDKAEEIALLQEVGLNPDTGELPD